MSSAISIGTGLAISAGVGAAGSIAGAALSSNASKTAAGQQERAANAATQEEQYQFDQTNANEAPYRQAGTTALSQLSAGTAAGGQFTQQYTGADLASDPGYQFRLQQGLKGVQNSGSAAGMNLSGAQLSALDQYNQGFASNEYQNAYNRYTSAQQQRYNNLYSIAGLGQQATAVTGQLGQQTANQISSNDIGAGNAAAAGTVGSANAINGGISNLTNTGMSLANLYSQNQALTSSSYGTGTGIVNNASNAAGYTNGNGVLNMTGGY